MLLTGHKNVDVGRNSDYSYCSLNKHFSSKYNGPTQRTTFHAIMLADPWVFTCLETNFSIRRFS